VFSILYCIDAHHLHEATPRIHGRRRRALMRVGFIGLGRMGQGMAARIFGGGHDLIVYNRTPHKMMDLVKSGARGEPSVAAACERREVVISMVADDTALKEVVLGSGGIRSALAAGASHVAMGTHSVGTVQMIAHAHGEAKQNFVSAPVLGRPDVAATGQVLI